MTGEDKNVYIAVEAILVQSVGRKKLVSKVSSSIRYVIGNSQYRTFSAPRIYGLEKASCNWRFIAIICTNCLVLKNTTCRERTW